MSMSLYTYTAINDMIVYSVPSRPLNVFAKTLMFKIKLVTEPNPHPRVNGGLSTDQPFITFVEKHSQIYREHGCSQYGTITQQYLAI